MKKKKNMKRVSWNYDREVTGPKYGSWLYKHGRRSPDGEIEEPWRANPDQVLEGRGLYAVDDVTKELQERVRGLLAIAKQILTDRQYLVFKFMAINEPPLTEREVAKALSISRGRVHQLWEAVRQKLQRAYVERTA